MTCVRFFVLVFMVMVEYTEERIPPPSTLNRCSEVHGSYTRTDNTCVCAAISEEFLTIASIENFQPDIAGIPWILYVSTVWSLMSCGSSKHVK